jgi:hypothetical protein
MALARTNVLKEGISSIIMAKRISGLGSTLPVTSNSAGNVIPSSLILFTLLMEALRYSETSVLTRATRGHIAEGGILQLQ